MWMNLSIPDMYLLKKYLPIFYIICLFILSVLLLPKIIDFFHYVITILRYPYVWALTENENMLFMHSILFAEPVYTLKQVNTFSYFVYPPIFHVFSAICMKIFGFSIFIPRIISLFSFFASLGVLWGVFRKQENFFENTLITFVLAASAVSISLYSMYFILARVDMLAYAFAFGSVFLLWKISYENQRNRINYFLASFLAICAVFTKQSAFFPYIIVFFLLFWEKNRLNWLFFGIKLAFSTIIVFFSLQLFTWGEFLKSLIISQEVYGKHLYATNHLLWLQSTFIEQFTWFLLAAALLFFISSYQIVVKKNKPSFSLLVMLAVYSNFLLTGGNTGAAYNTLIPLIFSLVLVIKEMYFLDTSFHLQGIIRFLLFILFILQIITFQKFYYPYTVPSERDKKNQEVLIHTLKKSPNQYILGDRIDYAILLAGKKSSLEASTHNVAAEWKNTRPYAQYVENTLIERMVKKQISFAVIGITKLGHEKLLSYVTKKGMLIQTIRISYLDASDLEHLIYQIR